MFPGVQTAYLLDEDIIDSDSEVECDEDQDDHAIPSHHRSPPPYLESNM